MVGFHIHSHICVLYSHYSRHSNSCIVCLHNMYYITLHGWIKVISVTVNPIQSHFFIQAHVLNFNKMTSYCWYANFAMTSITN